MNQKDKNAIEEELKNYPKLKAKIGILKNKIAYQEDYAAQSIDYSQIPGGKTNNINSDIEKFVQNKLDRYPEVYNLILKLKKIESALKCLTWREGHLVKLKYFQNFTDYEIVFKMYEYEKTIFNSKIEEELFLEINYKDYSVAKIQRMKLDVLKKLYNIGFCENEQKMSNF